MHADVMSVNAGGIAAGGQERTGPVGRRSVLRPVSKPFSPTGGLRLLQGRLGRTGDQGVCRARRPPHHQAPPASLIRKGLARRLQCGRGQPGHGRRGALSGARRPMACRAAQAHAPLAVLQNQGFKVALVTDGRMSGASNRCLLPSTSRPRLAGGPLAKVRDGDMVRVDAVAGTLDVLVDEATWAARAPRLTAPLANRLWSRTLHQLSPPRWRC